VSELAGTHPQAPLVAASAWALSGPPTVALFATSPSARAAARGRLPLGATVVVAGTWASARAAAEAVDCLLIARATDDDRALVPLVRDCVAGPRIPVVVCAATTASERAGLDRCGVAAVVEPWESGPRLWGEVQRSVSAALLARTTERLAEVRLAPALRGALVRLCMDDPPPSSVAELCAAVGAHRRTVWYQWRGRVRTRAPRLEDVVTTVLLLRAFMRRVPGDSWSAIAERSGVHRHTIARGAVRLLHLPTLPPRVGETADAAHAAARRAFVENVVRPVLRRQVP
jgi:hypothetical protein